MRLRAPNYDSNHVTLFIPGILNPKHPYGKDLNVATVSYSWRRSLQENGREAAVIINELKTQFPEVYGIGHSIGGLILRYAVETYGGEVTRYATLATPNGGLRNNLHALAKIGSHIRGFTGVCKDITDSAIEQLKKSEPPVPLLNIYSVDDPRVLPVEVVGRHVTNIQLKGLTHRGLLNNKSIPEILKMFLLEGMLDGEYIDQTLGELRVQKIKS